MEIISLIVGIVGLVIFFVFDFLSKIKALLFTVSITPKTISVDKSDWVTKTSIQVVNNKSYPIYSLQLEFTEVVVGSQIDGVIIKPEPNIVGGIDMNAFVISKKNKTTKLKTKVAPIHQLNAGATLNIDISIPATKKIEEFRIKVTDYKKNPAPVRQQGKATLVNFDLK